jgi:hypothetical protein
MAWLMLCAALEGCHSALWRADAPGGRSRTLARASIDGGDRAITGIVVAVLLAGELRYYIRGDDGSLAPLGSPAEPDPARAIAEQDCAGPIDPARGNLRCR